MAAKLHCAAALVLTQGRIVSPGAVYGDLGIKPFVADEPLVKQTTQ